MISLIPIHLKGRFDNFYKDQSLSQITDFKMIFMISLIFYFRDFTDGVK
jgi:hypothetical protein